MADGERLLAQCAEALAGGAALLQYRSKHTDAGLRRAQATAMLALARRHGVPLIINDDIDLALAIGADGAHIGRDDGDVASARAHLGAGRILGVSCYDTLDRARDAAAAGADYVAFGAMFPSATKPGAVRAPLSILTRAVQELDVPVAAIGGITLDNAGALIAAGASLLAVVSDVFDDPEPGRRSAAYQPLFGTGTGKYRGNEERI
ncbi:MAG: thiamine phosphate synthase [Rhodocyclaceae bacterium]|nr:thiamine phosphate synthase [Rhodocyclaceae bacterium]